MSSSSRKSLDSIPARRLYGRRVGKALGKERAEAIEKRLPQFSVPQDMLSGQADLDPKKLFANSYDDIWMEIGFGNGTHLSALMQKYPKVGFLGAEPFVNGMAAFLKDNIKNPDMNARVLMDDALLLVNSLKDQSIGRLYVLNPDPWPKARHHKRRMIRTDNLNIFARVMKPGAELIMATDVDDLAQWMREQCEMHDEFEWSENSKADRHTPPPEWIETRFAEKGKQAGRTQSFIVFKRK